MSLTQLPSPSLLRLPAYRSTYLGRFHPYPRGGPRASRDLDFNDNSTSTPIRVPYEGPRLDKLLPTIQEDISDSDLVKLNQVVSNGKGGRVRRLSLSTIVIDLAHAIRRRMAFLRAAQKDNDHLTG